MINSRTPAESAAAVVVMPVVALKVRVPVLRRPPGWCVLEEPALRVRATQLYLASMEQVHPLERVRGEGGGTVPGLPGSWQEAASLALQETPVPGPGPGLSAPLRLAAPVSCEPLRVDPVAAAQPHAVFASRKGSHWHLLPWGLLLGGAMLLAPWLIWAPLVGGLCLGLLLLQTGMLRQWLQAREADEDAALTAPGHDADGVAVPAALADDARIEAAQGVGTRRLRWAHGGWMLTAALVLVGVQAAMLITTVQIKNREPAALAGAIRAAHPGREARQGTAPGAQELLQPLPVRGAAALGGRPGDEPTEPTGPRQGSTP